MFDHRILADGADDVAALHHLSLADRGDELPGAVPGEGRRFRPPFDETPALFPDSVERALHAVVNGAEEAGAELYGEGVAAVFHRLTEAESLSLLVDLDGDLVPVDADDLADQPRGADADQVVHGRGVEPAGDDGRTRDVHNSAAAVAHCLILRW